MHNRLKVAAGRVQLTNFSNEFEQKFSGRITLQDRSSLEGLRARLFTWKNCSEKLQEDKQREKWERF